MIKLICERIIGWLKDILKKGRDMSFEFPKIAVIDIKRKINLIKRAETDGRNNIPPANSIVRSNCEEEAITEYDNQRHQAVDNAVKFLDPIKHKITGYNAILSKKHYFIDELKEKVQKSLNTTRGRTSNLIDVYKKQNEELKHFKLSHDITRDPKSLTVNKIIIGLLFVLGLFYIEVEVNKALLAPALMGGEKEAQGVVFAVAALNVFISFLAGYFLVKNFNLNTSLKKTVSQIILTIYGFFIIYLNWCLGAFRAIAEQKGEVRAWGQAEQNIAEVMDYGNVLLPWTVSFSFYAVVLTFVGMSFALFSLLDGYFFDDTYPGYGAVGKGRNENKKEINRYREFIITEIGRHFKLENQSINEKRETLLSKTLKNWSINITTIESAFAAYYKFAKKISDDTNHIIKEYIGKNREFRTDDATPKYWTSDDQIAKKRHYELEDEKTDPKKVFPDLAQVYLDNKQIEEEIKKFSNKIVEESNKYQTEVNEYKKEVDKEVNQLRKDYEVD